MHRSHNHQGSSIAQPQIFHQKITAAAQPMRELFLADKIFLAYQVNGVPLPQKHGFPLRLVAEDHYGHEWVKYVHRITVEKDPGVR
ncbi:MAG: molybdopterin-dependent oxidoreductase [Pseudomonadota bacterium]